jgi:hypothetical protein
MNSSSGEDAVCGVKELLSIKHHIFMAGFGSSWVQGRPKQAKRLGHTSSRMVDSTYVNLYAEVSRQVADAIDEAADRAETLSAAGPERDERGTPISRTSGRAGGNRP